MTGLRGVAVGGALGAAGRACLVLIVGAGSWVGAEVAVIAACNLLGAALLGWVAGRAEVDDRWRRRADLVGTGVAGALTTFSGLALALVGLADHLGWLATVAVGVAHVAVGVAVARATRVTSRRRAVGGRGWTDPPW